MKLHTSPMAPNLINSTKLCPYSLSLPTSSHYFNFKTHPIPILRDRGIMVSSCEQIENMLSASNEWPQNYHQIKEGDQDDEQIRSLNTTTTTTTTTNNNNNKMMMMAETKEVEGGGGGGTRLMEKPSQEQIQHQQQQQPLKCPRCESTNTKFCYYNNYSLSQPRHFCKACKRYWTRGGTLRSVPVGGGCRKNKRIRRNPNFSNSTTSTTNSSSNNSSSNNMSDSNTFNSHQSLNPSGGVHLISPLLYGLPTNLVPPTHHHHHASPHEAIMNGFPFSSSYDNLGGIGLGFSSGGMILGGGDHRNGYSTTTPKQILQDLISNSHPSSHTFHGSLNSNSTSSTTITTTTTLPTMSMSSLLTSSLEQHQQKFNLETLFPYELDLQIKGVGSHGSEGVYMKEDSVKLEGDDHPHGHCQTQNGYDQIHDHDHDDDRHHQQQPMGDSDPSILWNNNNSNGTSIGVNWLDPNYSSLGSSSVPSLI